MSGRQSSATELALKLYDKGANKSQACKKAGISWTTLHRALERRKKKSPAPKRTA